MRPCVPLPQRDGGIPLSKALSGAGSWLGLGALISLFFGGGTRLFPWSTHLSASPRGRGSLPLPLHAVAIRGVQPRGGSRLFPATTPCSPPLPPSHPHLGFRGSPSSPSWDQLFVPFPEQKLGHRPQNDSCSGGAWGHSGMARLWGQHWVAVPYRQRCQVLVTAPLATGGDTALCHTARAVTDSGDTTSVEETCPVSYGVYGIAWSRWPLVASGDIKSAQDAVLGDIQLWGRLGTRQCCDAQLSLSTKPCSSPKVAAAAEAAQGAPLPVTSGIPGWGQCPQRRQQSPAGIYSNQGREAPISPLSGMGTVTPHEQCQPRAPLPGGVPCPRSPDTAAVSRLCPRPQGPRERKSGGGSICAGSCLPCLPCLPCPAPPPPYK